MPHSSGDDRRSASAAADDTTAERQTPPSDTRERYAQALAAMRDLRYDDARAMLQALAEAHPGLSGPHTNLGIIAARVADDPAVAMRHFRAAVAANSANATAHNWIGVLLRQEGAHAAAERAYQRALELRPEYAMAHRNIGILYDLYLDKPEKAAYHYRRYLALGEGEGSLIVRAWLNALPGVEAGAPVVAASKRAEEGQQ